MIAVDWGTTSLRAFRLDDAGEIVAQRRAAQGILACNGRFESVLAEQLAEWSDTTVVLAGMIGSRQGWVEAPYVECPAGPVEIARAMLPLSSRLLADRRIWIVPGVAVGAVGAEARDVMRGEEVQVCGLLASLEPGRHVVCLPGTHSKWVVVDNGRIQTLFTAMTGEVFQVLREHSLLGRLMTSGSHDDPVAFCEGLARARQAGGLLHHLFSVRTRGLFGSLQPAQLSSYLSGLLIGHETLHAPSSLTRVHLVAAAALAQPYAIALRELGVDVEMHGEELAAAGMHVVARGRGLV